MRAPHSSAGSTADCLGILQCRTSATGFFPKAPIRTDVANRSPNIDPDSQSMMGNSDLNAKPPFQVLVCRVFQGALASRLQALLVLGRRIESSMASLAATSERNSSIGKLSGMWFLR